MSRCPRKNGAKPLLDYSGYVSPRITAGVLVLLFTTAILFAAAQQTPGWKPYLSSKYGVEISYPANWQFIPGNQNDDGKPPSPGQHPAFAGETRDLFGLEMDGPSQSKDGGGSFDDGVIVVVRITAQAEPWRTGT